MRKSAAAVLLAVALSAAAASAGAPVAPVPAAPPAVVVPAPPPRDVLVDGATLEQEIDRLLEGVAAVQALAQSPAADADASRALQRELEGLRTGLVALRQTVREAPAAMPAPTEIVEIAALPGPPEVPAGEEPMTRDDFEAALASIASHGFAAERLEVIAQLARGNWFVVEQARRVIESFSFGKDRLQALELLAPRIVDRQNDFRLFEAFTFESDKAQARRILSAQQP